MSNTAHSTKPRSTHTTTTSQKASKKKNTENLGEAAKKLEAADALAAASVADAKRMRDEADVAMEAALRAKTAADQAAATIKSGTARGSRGSHGVKTTAPGGVQAHLRKRGVTRQTDSATPPAKKVAHTSADNSSRPRSGKVASDVIPLSQG